MVCGGGQRDHKQPGRGQREREAHPDRRLLPLTVDGGIGVNGSNSFTIYGQTGGTGSLNADATTNSSGAGIGSNIGSSGGTITVSGGTVTAAASGGSAAIGDGYNSGGSTFSTGAGGTAIIYATGDSGAGSTFSTGAGGTAIIYATGDSGAAAISDQSGKTAGAWSGIIFEGDAGAVYGNQSNSGSFTIAEGQSLEILSGSSFTNNGTLTIDGDLTNNGSFTNNGPVTVPMTGSFVDNGTLNCTYHSYESGLCVLRCGGIAVSGISLDNTELKLMPGNTAALRATVSPDNASNKDLTWSSSDSGIATVDENGTVTAHKAGKATITATAADGSGKTATCTVTVLVPVSSVTLSRSSLRIYEGGSYSLSAAVSPADAADKGIVWSSSDPSIATVDQKGKVIGKAPGVCTIYATAADGSGAFASCTVRVLRWFPGATPITGDSSNLGVWIGLLGASLVAVGAAAFILIKKRKKK